jgi:hypothetical protein
MSQYRQDFPQKLATKGAFGALQVEDVPSDDEEDAPVIVEQPEPAPVVAAPYVSERQRARSTAYKQIIII